MRAWIWGLVALAGLLATVFAVLTLWPAREALSNIKDRRLEGIRTEIAAHGFELGAPIFIRIFKESGELELWMKNDATFSLYKTFPVCRWSGALGPKLREGDGQSPEGFYRVTRGQMVPNSDNHLAFNLGFPNAYDRAQGRTGSFLMVHGRCVSIGCYAMTNTGIEEIWLIADAALDAGQTAFDVHIFPFRMNAETWAHHAGSPWASFWKMLEAGNDRFEATKIPPKISVVNGTYAVQ